MNISAVFLYVAGSKCHSNAPITKLPTKKKKRGKKEENIGNKNIEKSILLIKDLCIFFKYTHDCIKNASIKQICKP